MGARLRASIGDGRVRFWARPFASTTFASAAETIYRAGTTIAGDQRVPAYVETRPERRNPVQAPATLMRPALPAPASGTQRRCDAQARSVMSRCNFLMADEAPSQIGLAQIGLAQIGWDARMYQGCQAARERRRQTARQRPVSKLVLVHRARVATKPLKRHLQRNRLPCSVC